jgi:hypothetical protein
MPFSFGCGHWPRCEPQSENGYGLSHYAGNAFVVMSDTPKKLNDFPNGTNTIVVGEVSSNFRPWGDPLNVRDPRLTGSSRSNGFSGPNGRPPLLGMLDGSVRTFDPGELARQTGEVPE